MKPSHTQQESKNPGRFDLEGLCQPRTVVSSVFTLPDVYFARTIDFPSYVDATMSIYSIM